MIPHNKASTVFIETAEGKPSAADDALQAKVFSRDNLPEQVFDHALIVDDYFSGRY